MSRLSSEPKYKNHQRAIETIKKAAQKWPSTFVARSKIGEFSGGLVAPGTLANADCLGKGPSGAFKIGRHVAYPTESVADWLIGRLV